MIICPAGIFSRDSEFECLLSREHEAAVGQCHVVGGAGAFTQAGSGDSAMVHFYQGSVGAHLALEEGSMPL